MDKVDLTKVKRLRQTYQVEFASELIAAGYELIATASGQDEQGAPLLNYALAWFKDEKPEGQASGARSSGSKGPSRVTFAG